MTASTKFTGVDVVESTNRSAIGSFVTWMIFLIMAATKSVPSSGGASGKKKADWQLGQSAFLIYSYDG